jgi:dihydroorotase
VSDRLAFVNARLVDPGSGLDTTGALVVEGGRIADLGPGILGTDKPSGLRLIDCGGHVLAPALVDMRVQLREPGEEHKETMATAAAAALVGGVGTMVQLPNTSPAIDDLSLVEFVERRSRAIGSVDIRCYGAATKGLAGSELTEMGLMSEAGAVGFTDGVRTIASAMVMRRALSYAKTFGQMIVQHAEEPTLTTEAGMNEGEIATRLGIPGIPGAAEAIMVERDLRLAELTGGRYHVAHLSTAAAIEAVRQAKRRGVDVSCDTAPPYFALNETAIGDYRTFAKLSPPLRSEWDRRAVVDGLADGTIDAIASDHAPHDQDSKRLPFAQAASGILGLETLLPLTLELVHNKHLGLSAALAKLTVNPAQRLGLAAGRLMRGAKADLVVIDFERPYRIDVGNFKSKSKNSPFDGRPVEGIALATVLGGRILHVIEGAPAGLRQPLA